VKITRRSEWRSVAGDLETSSRAAKNAVAGLVFAKVLTGPLHRATRTFELAAFGDAAEIDRDLFKRNYDDYEDPSDAEIDAKQPSWELFRDGCPMRQ
jgi:broad specificity phosphatase PhoE